MYKKLEKEKVSIAYFGLFSDEITSMMIELSESHLSKVKVLNKLSKKTSFLIAESFQNVIRHGILEKENIPEIQHNKDFYKISIIDDRVILTSANVIKNYEAIVMNDQIDHLNSLDTIELKELYFDTFQNRSFSEKGGAGLGLIQMVRKAGLPIKKHIIPLAKDYSLLILGLELMNPKEPNYKKENKFDTKETEEFYRNFVGHNVLLAYKGNFSSTTISALTDMLRNNFMVNGEINPARLKNILVIIEIMQNVEKHGKFINGLVEGVFLITNNDNDIYIECSNFIHQKDYANFKTYLKKIKNTGANELEELYNATIDANPSNDKELGLGLLKIASLTKNTFTYNFEEIADDEIYFTLKLKTN